MINDNDKPQHTKTEDLLKDVNKRPQKKSQYTTLITNSLDAFLETEDPIHTVRKEVRKAIGITDEYVITKNESKSLQASSIDNNMISSTMDVRPPRHWQSQRMASILTATRFCWKIRIIRLT